MTESPEDLLREAGTLPDERIDLAEAALSLAALDRPRVGLQRYRDHIAELTRDLRDLLASGCGPAAAAAEVIHERNGYRGDELTYDDLQNANLMRVIDRKKGLPVALGILHLHALRACGEEAQGLNFPGHFLVRVEAAGRRTIIDPFDGGNERKPPDLRELLKALTGADAELEPDHCMPVGNRDILIRLQNNIKVRHHLAGRWQQALDTLSRMLLFAPDSMPLWREAGLRHVQLGNLSAAVKAFETVAVRSRSDEARYEAAAAIQKLKTRLN